MKIRPTFVLILPLFILIYAVCHMAIYVSIVRFFGLHDHFAKTVIIYILSIMGASFFVSALIAHVQDNIFSRAFYLLSGIWMGILVNLMVFFIFAWAIVLLGINQFFGINDFAIGTAAVAMALLYSAYGIWKAFSPVVRSIDVSMRNLPEQWVGKKIVQISDVHLGHVYREKYFSGIVDKINQLSPEAIVITGDLFDGTDGKLDDFAGQLKRLSAPSGVYFVTGNHETYIGSRIAKAVLSKTHIIWLKDSLQTVGGLQFIGINYPLRGKGRSINKLIPKMPGWDRSQPSILLIHEPVQTKSAKALGISLQLSGHTHRGQLFPFNFITAMIFGKYDYGLFQDEDYAIYTSSGLGGWGPPMRTESRSEIVEITLSKNQVS